MPSAKGLLLKRRHDAVLQPRTAHGEAFCLMKYVDEKRQIVEWIWNSRDGVTPFGIGEGFLHADWHGDMFMPNFVPPVGMRIIMSYCDAPPSKRLEIAERWKAHLDQWKDGLSPEQVVDLEVRPPFDIRPTDPVLVTVDQPLHDHFMHLALNNPFVSAR